jgi:hypothetical protein
MLTGIWDVNTNLEIHYNARTKVIKQVRTINNYDTVWYCKYVIANILSLSRVKTKITVHYNSSQCNQFVVVKPDNEVIFKERKEGLYYHDTSNRMVGT